MIHYLDELGKEDLQGKRVLLRLDLSVPVIEGELLSSFQIDRAIATIDYLREKEAQIVIISHSEDSGDTSLVSMWNYLNGYFPVEFCPTYFTPECIDKLLALKNKGVLLFENVRMNPGEKENNKEFARKLSQMADIYINDAFAVSHRKHASIVSVPEFLPHFAGLLMKEEIQNISKAFSPVRPFLFILGGAKFDTKLPLIKKYLTKADYIFVAGALANDIFKEKGYEVGTSLLTPGDFGIKDILNNPKLIIPLDVMVLRPDGTSDYKSPDQVLPDEYISDVGPKTMENLRKIISTSKTIVWNGPLGKYKKGFKDKTKELAKIITEVTEKNGIESIVGGGDTLTSIESPDIDRKFSFVSTGGGAMLDFLVNETLPGIEALEK